LYRIIKMDGSELAVVAKAMWVKIGPSGSLAPAKNRGDAVGIAYQSTAYNLLGFDRIPDAETVMVAEVDDGEYIQDVKNAMCETNAATDEWKAPRDCEPGELMTVNGGMYRVVLPIYAGTRITVGTNVEATTLGAEIAKLNKEETA